MHAVTEGETITPAAPAPRTRRRRIAPGVRLATPPSAAAPARPRTAGGAGAQRMITPAPCRCGRHVFVSLTIATGLTAFRAYCPVCESVVLVVRRRAAHVTTVPFDEERPELLVHALRVAKLAGVGLTDAEVQELGEVAGEAVVETSAPSRLRRWTSWRAG
jgi:hypothetical protein